MCTCPNAPVPALAQLHGHGGEDAGRPGGCGTGGAQQSRKLPQSLKCSTCLPDQRCPCQLILAHVSPCRPKPLSHATIYVLRNHFAMASSHSVDCYIPVLPVLYCVTLSCSWLSDVPGCFPRAHTCIDGSCACPPTGPSPVMEARRGSAGGDIGTMITVCGKHGLLLYAWSWCGHGPGVAMVLGWPWSWYDLKERPVKFESGSPVSSMESPMPSLASPVAAGLVCAAHRGAPQEHRGCLDPICQQCCEKGAA